MDNNKIFLNDGLVIWLTGLSGAGKSTISESLKDMIMSRTKNSVKVLDGDEIRENLSPDLDFSKEGRTRNIRRISYVAKCIVDCCGVAIVAAISPYKEDRQYAKKMIREDRFFEIFVDCDIDTLIERDVKGLYKKALSGEIENFTGISDPYEIPKNPNCIVNSNTQSLEESLEIIKDSLNAFLQEGKRDMYYI